MSVTKKARPDIREHNTLYPKGHFYKGRETEHLELSHM